MVDILQTAINQNFTTLVNAVSKAALNNTLKTGGPLTVFAPTDSAFAQLPSNVLTALLDAQNNRTLTKILRYHVAGQNLTSTMINDTALTTINMTEGGVVTVSKNGSALKVNNANIIIPNVMATNGIIHGIDKVLLPAFDIVETALTNGAFMTLVSFLRMADLTGTLQGKGPFTVFAPTDSAFAKLSNATVTDLLNLANRNKLINILKYHVIDRRITAADIGNMTFPANIKMLSGNSVTITKNGLTLKINNATITATNLDTLNGIIHTIDTVLIPLESSPSTASNCIHQGLVSIIILTLLIRFM